METTNSYLLKITGAAELSGQLEPRHTVRVSAEVDIYEVAKHDNQDGTFDISYKARVVGPVEAKQGEIKIPGKDRRRKSQKLRAVMYIDAKEQGEDTDVYYEMWMDKLIKNWELVREFLLDK